MKDARTMPGVVPAAFAIGLLCVVAATATAYITQAPPSLAVALPEGEGKALVERACTGCHDPSLVVFKREDEEGWAVIVNDMAARGAKATEDELKIITASGLRGCGGGAWRTTGLRRGTGDLSDALRGVSSTGRPRA